MLAQEHGHGRGICPPFRWERLQTRPDSPFDGAEPGSGGILVKAARNEPRRPSQEPIVARERRGRVCCRLTAFWRRSSGRFGVHDSCHSSRDRQSRPTLHISITEVADGCLRPRTGSQRLGGLRRARSRPRRAVTVWIFTRSCSTAPNQAPDPAQPPLHRSRNPHNGLSARVLARPTSENLTERKSDEQDEKKGRGPATRRDPGPAAPGRR